MRLKSFDFTKIGKPHNFRMTDSFFIKISIYFINSVTVLFVYNIDYLNILRDFIKFIDPTLYLKI